jgi:lipid-A-disaccharide synthase
MVIKKIKKPFRIFFSAGEDSGDILAANLFLKLKEKKTNIVGYGLTGQTMKKSGIRSLFDLENLKVMGFQEVLSKLPELKILEQRLLQKIDQDPPDLAILVDYQEFNQNLAEQIKLRGIPSVLYVAPQVWAWREKRAENLHKKVDLILGLLPFEKTFFEKYSVNYEFIGSDIFDRTEPYRKNLKEKLNVKKIIFFPGSRLSEIKHMLPLMIEIIKHMNQETFQISIQIKDSVKEEELNNYLTPFGILLKKNCLELNENGKTTSISITRKDGILMMSHADFAVVTSGTASLECALLGTPLFILYKTSFINYTLVSNLLKTDHIALPNIVLKRRAFDEFLQKIDPKEIAKKLDEKLKNNKELEDLKDSLKELRSFFTPHASEKAASLLLEKFFY